METFDYIFWPCSVEIYDNWKNNLEGILEKIKIESPYLFKKFVDKKILLRGWCWKPRTLPGWFEGYGKDAVKVMSKIQKKYNVFCATEVWTAEHIKICFRYWITHLWIGARSTSNPFLMDKLAEKIIFYAKKNYINLWKITIGVKNPIWYDIDLWKGALLRLKKSWVFIYPIHRWYNFSKKWLKKDNQNLKFRNMPYTEEELKELEQIWFTLDDIVTDYSHIIGNSTNIIEELFKNRNHFPRKKMMIEIHPDPTNALTDSNQQILPNDIIFILRKKGYIQKY